MSTGLVQPSLGERPETDAARTARRGMTHLYCLACNPTIPYLPEGSRARCGRVRQSPTTAVRGGGVECVVCADAHVHDYCAGCGR